MTAEKVRQLVTQAWADYHLPPPPALIKADPGLVAAELNRRRKRFADRCAADLAECDRLEQAIRDARTQQGDTT